MSDHPKEALRELRRIVICADICLAVFRLLPPAKVGLELALVSCRFDALVDAHFRSRRWALGNLEIDTSSLNGSVEIFKQNKDGILEKLPIPLTPLPNGVVGFARIMCCCITDDAIAFLRRIGRLFQSDITLKLFRILGNPFGNFFWPLLNPPFGIVKMRFNYEKRKVLNRLRSLISPSVLRDCANLRFVSVGLSFGLQFPPDDSAGASDGQALCKWLHTPLADGRPKVLRLRYPFNNTTMEQLKTEFLSASTGVNFMFIFSIIHYTVYVSPFEVENNWTNERMTMRPIGNNAWIVMRSPIGKNVDQWAKWEREALETEAFDWKVLEFDVLYD